MVEVPVPRTAANPVGWGDPPLAPTHASDPLGWPTGMAARRYSALPPIDAECRPEPSHRLFVLRPSTPRLRAWWSWGGASLDHRRGGLGSADPIVCVVPAGQGQRWAWDGGTIDAVEVLLSPQLVAGSAPAVASAPPRLVGSAGAADPVALRLAAVLESLLREPCPGAAAVAAGLAPALCSHLLGRYSDVQSNGDGRGRLSNVQAVRAAQYLGDNLGRRVGTRELATVVLGRRCSPVHFARLFKARFGDAPGRHLLKMRVEAVRGLLAAEPDLSVSEAAQRFGFFDHSHLNRHYRRVTGENPRRKGRSSLAAGAAAEWLCAASDVV